VRHKLHTEWDEHHIAVPEFIGRRVLKDFPLAELVPFIDWSPFFHTWEMRGRYPDLLSDPTRGPAARELFANAQELLQKVVGEKLFTANGVYGFYPVNSDSDDIIIYADVTRTQELTRLHTLRQQKDNQRGKPQLALADFIAPRESGHVDYLGVFAVTTGHGTQELAERFDKDLDQYNSIMAKALADRLAEAFAECLHKRVRAEWGYGKDEKLSNEEMIAEKYRGIRPAPGYPSQPDHTEKPLIFDLLQVGEATGITLTESFAMYPASSVCGIYFAHKDAHYFAVSSIGKDQVESYAARKGMKVAEVERWLSPILGYDPAKK
jgi:5-methyltetrahydrofolate--homocysteine methyltransferase